MNTTALDKPEQISLASLAVLRSALLLEMKGMKKRGQSALAIAKARGYKGTRETIADAILVELRAF